MRKINLIVVHCTATPATRTITAADVDSWHKARGFRVLATIISSIRTAISNLGAI